jgi:hypothetical protein
MAGFILGCARFIASFSCQGLTRPLQFGLNSPTNHHSVTFIVRELMNFSKLSLLLLISILLVALLSCSGCSDDDNPVDPPAEETPIMPPTRDNLMEIFVAINTSMALDDLRDILHEDFQFLLSYGMVSDWGLAPGSTMDRDQMIRIHSNMFGGLAGIDENGNNINPLARIEVSLFEREGEWVDVPNDDLDFPGTKRAFYNVRIFFHDNTGGHAFEVDQPIIFYAGQVNDYWYLQGVRTLGLKSTESNGYDDVLYLYNSAPEKTRD